MYTSVNIYEREKQQQIANLKQRSNTAKYLNNVSIT